MKVFISWSGSDSRAIAEFLQGWLKNVLMERVTPFVSSQDIAKGARGMDIIASSLEDTGFGLVVLTQANQDAKWINFEAGALGKDLGTSRVAPLLVDLTQSDVSGPLTQFQMTSVRDQDDVWKLLRDMNKLLDGEPMPEVGLKVLFEKFWPELEAAVTAAADGREPATTTRDQAEILDEILLRVRRIERSRRDPGHSWGASRKAEVAQTIARCITELDKPIKYRFRDMSEGMVLHVDAGSAQVEFDSDLLQGVADRYGVRIVVEPHDAMFIPRGRFRDPAHAFRPSRTEREADRAVAEELNAELYGHQNADDPTEP
ncbi:toll/interleukin-1 receptor domain-containing protein [Microbacterium lacticum]|uniref:TIR domain-containing protein n=1 Tax=Microbacterium lacticum TaxID=33885 RepID=A0A4Y3UL17_9MICO|nr:TIR domain-containing protein [Microbacterium lacticum]TQN00750.1 TIR domain-containing protein [Microbacterium lacticum]GEB94168.1 hypothetical protein MLA01_03870 [Microbacterium lacticum]GGN13832.1 hypothetical protein GCM10009724_04020 [Microbacterium lacticum]